jgi:hypothetical protein
VLDYLPKPSSEEKAIAWSALELAVQLVPFVGSALGTVVSNASRYQWESAMETAMAALRRQADPWHFVERVPRDERFGIAFTEAIRAAARTSLPAKRAAIGRALSEMCDADDPQAVDESEMLLMALTAIDIPHFRALRRISQAEVETDEVVFRSQSVSRAADAESAPIRAGLLQVGALELSIASGPTTGVKLTDFGRTLLAYVENPDSDVPAL